MSPRKVVQRQDWVAAMLTAMDNGRPPAEVSLNELAAGLKVTKGSFYAHFPGGAEELRQAVAQQWLAGVTAMLPGPVVGAVRDPVDRIRMTRAAVAGNSARDEAMRRWAAAEPAAAAAVAEADRIFASHLAPALTDLGLARPEAAAIADVLVASLHAGQGNFDAILAVIARAAAVPAEAATAGDAAGRVVRFTARRDLTATQRDLLDQIASQFASGPDPASTVPGGEEAGANGALPGVADGGPAGAIRLRIPRPGRIAGEQRQARGPRPAAARS